MKRINIKYTLLLAGILTVAISCKVTKPYEQPQLNTNDLYRGQQTTDTTTIASLPWEKLFTDTVLKALIHEGLYSNLNLKIAVQKIYEAQAALGQSKAALLPSLSASAGVTRSKLSGPSLGYPAGAGPSLLTTQYLLGLCSSWEADIWGKLFCVFCVVFFF